MTNAAPLYRHPSLEGRVVLVTGGARGLGREMVLELASAGARVAVVASAPGSELDRTVELARESGGPDSAHAFAADVSRPGACEKLFAEVEERMGNVDVLINNAGRGMRLISETFNTVPTRFWEAEPEAWKAIVDINLNGAFYMAREAARRMVERGFGKIVNISTSDQTMVRRGYSPYGPTKAALEASSRVWAQDLQGTGVDVNVFLPGGAADTDLLPPSANRKGADGNLLPAAIMRRGIGWLCSDESNGMTGARFIARLWDEGLSPSEAAKAARVPPVERPSIM